MANNGIEQFVWEPTKTDSEKGRWLLDAADFTLPKDFVVAQSAVVGFGPRGWAANHWHERREALLGLAGELYLVWRDGGGKRHEQRLLRNDGRLVVFLIGSQVPHLVENRSEATAALYEWSDNVDESIPLEGDDSLRLLINF